MSLPDPFHRDASNVLYVGDCVDVLAAMDPNSVDAVVTDPPYGLEFMGQEWDAPWKQPAGSWEKRDKSQDLTGKTSSPYLAARVNQYKAGRPFQAWCEQWAAECLRVLKPGGHLLAFGGTRTYHRLACAVEDAGFEVRDCLAWLYGSGFPKSLDVGKAIDAAAGAEREVVDRWDGWGTALKPAHEPIVLARKPLAGTVASNVVEHGTGALNVLGCRIPAAGGSPAAARRESARKSGKHPSGTTGGMGWEHRGSHEAYTQEHVGEDAGRWPANVVLGCACEGEHDRGCAVAMLDQQSGVTRSPTSRERTPDPPAASTWALARTEGVQVGHDDEGGASRFFYVAKASRAERDAANSHPTVKPVALMRWLIRMVTPSGGTVLDPFAGSGTTAVAATIEGRRCVLVEREENYAGIIVRRLSKPIEPTLDLG